VSEPQYRSRPARARWIIVTVLAGLGAVIGALAYAGSVVLSDEWGRSQIDLVESFTKASPNPDWPYLDASDRTAEVCGSRVNCVQAVRSEYVTVLKFHSVEEARKYTETLGPDGVQIDPLVVHFDGIPLSAVTRADIVHTLSNINVDFPD